LKKSAESLQELAERIEMPVTIDLYTCNLGKVNKVLSAINTAVSELENIKDRISDSVYK
jgi:hypothetical protein